MAVACRPEDEQINLQNRALDLKRILHQRPELRRLATTPLLCAMILCPIWRARRKFTAQNVSSFTKSVLRCM